MSPARIERPTYMVRLQPLPEVEDPIRALRAALKQLLRRHGFRCVEISASIDDVAPPPVDE